MLFIVHISMIQRFSYLYNRKSFLHKIAIKNRFRNIEKSKYETEFDFFLYKFRFRNRFQKQKHHSIGCFRALIILSHSIYVFLLYHIFVLIRYRLRFQIIFEEVTNFCYNGGGVASKDASADDADGDAWSYLMQYVFLLIFHGCNVEMEMILRLWAKKMLPSKKWNHKFRLVKFHLLDLIYLVYSLTYSDLP